MSEAHPVSFIHLRCHSEYSITDGIVRIDDYVDKAFEENMPALALTDLNNGNLDLVFVDNSMLLTYVNKMKLPLTSSYEIPYADKLGFAFVKGSPIREDFNKYLAELGQDKIKAMEEKWSK